MDKKLKSYINDFKLLNNIPFNKKGELLNDIEDIINNICLNFEDCIKWALNFFCEQYRNKILQLKYNFPIDSKIKSGELFWKGIKKFPKEIIFNIDNNNHVMYIYYLSNLRADLFEIDRCLDIYKIKDLIKNIKLPNFTPLKNVFINTDMNNDKTEVISNNLVLPNLKKYKNLKLKPIKLDLDSKNNFHLECIAYMSNARAVNYYINPKKNFKIKKIISNIKPSLITTTSLMAGIGTIEILKLIQKHKNIKKYKNTEINLSLPLIKKVIPNIPELIKYNSNKFTIWDNFEINKKITLRNLLLFFKEKHNIDLNMIVYNRLILYSFFTNKEKIKERMGMNIETIIKKIDKNNKKKTYKLTISSHKYENLPDY